MEWTEKRKLKPIKQQLGMTWKLFAAGWWKFLLILGLPYLLYIGIFILASRIGSSSNSLPLTLGLGYLIATLMLAYIALYFVALAGMIYSLDKAENTTVMEAYRMGADNALSLVWITFLVSLILTGGFFLLVIPGVIFLIRYSFAPFALIHGGLRGRHALRESRRLVKGYWWAVFGRLIIFYIIIVTVQIQAKMLLPTVNSNIIAVIIQPLLAVFFIIYAFVIYRDLVQVKRPETPSPYETPCSSSPSPPADS
jgi:hypothetical protein